MKRYAPGLIGGFVNFGDLPLPDHLRAATPEARSAALASLTRANVDKVMNARAVEIQLAALLRNPPLKGQKMPVQTPARNTPRQPPAIVALDPVRVYDKWMRRGERGLSNDEQQILNTMSTTTGSQGGYTVPSEVLPTLMAALKAYRGVRTVATQITRGSGAPLTVPLSDGTAEVGELLAQNASSTSADPVFAGIAMNPFKFGSKCVTVPIELLQDSSIDIAEFVLGRAAERIGRAQNNYFTTGAGTTEPFGVVTRAASGRVGTTGQTLTVIYDDLVALLTSVDAAYRDPERSAWMMSDAAYAQVLKIKDTAGAAMFKDGGPILGYPVVINNAVAAMAANAKSILFGNFSRYEIHDVADPWIVRTTANDSPFVKLGQVGFWVYARSTGDLTDNGGAIKYYQNSAT